MEELSHNEMLTKIPYFWEIFIENNESFQQNFSYSQNPACSSPISSSSLIERQAVVSTKNTYRRFAGKISMLQSINVKHTDFSTRLHLWWSKPISDVYLPLLLATYPHSHLLLQTVVRRNTSTFISSHSQFYCIPGHSSSSIQTQAPRTLFWGLGLGRAECLSH